MKKQVGGTHYSKLPIEPVDFIVKNDIKFREGNAIKYIVRHQDKNGAEDIKKAIHFLEMILKDYEDEETTNVDSVDFSRDNVHGSCQCAVCRQGKGSPTIGNILRGNS